MNNQWYISRIDIDKISADENFCIYYETVSEQMLKKFSAAEFIALKSEINRAYIFSKDRCFHIRKRNKGLSAVVVSRDQGEKPLYEIETGCGHAPLAGKIVPESGVLYEARVAKIGMRLDRNYSGEIKILTLCSKTSEKYSIPVLM
ncbi:MAG TPA: hypothetical protein PKW98_09940 [Candidatus Wallbacteria bacterium]|nr:hypothetical protein [Candidatus Wallbacteria bacterium]